jgi:hypothetical protein
VAGSELPARNARTDRCFICVDVCQHVWPSLTACPPVSVASPVRPAQGNGRANVVRMSLCETNLTSRSPFVGNHLHPKSDSQRPHGALGRHPQVSLSPGKATLGTVFSFSSAPTSTQTPRVPAYQPLAAAHTFRRASARDCARRKPRMPSARRGSPPARAVLRRRWSPAPGPSSGRTRSAAIATPSSPLCGAVVGPL